MAKSIAEDLLAQFAGDIMDAESALQKKDGKTGEGNTSQDVIKKVRLMDFNYSLCSLYWHVDNNYI